MAQADQQSVDPRFGLPDTLFFVIGGQKCGTTWLQRYFVDHPEVCVPAWKETSYWNHVYNEYFVFHFLETAYADRFKKWGARRDRLLRRIPDEQARIDRALKAAYLCSKDPGAPHKKYADTLFLEYTETTRACGEVCPQYSLLDESAFAEMSTLSLNTKFIYLLRDPVERLISGAKHVLRRRQDMPVVTTDDMDQLVMEHLADPDCSAMQLTAYHESMSRLEAAVPPQDIKYAFFEELFQQPTIDELCRFLGVSPCDGRFKRKSNADPEPELSVSETVRRQALNALSDVYAAMDQRFGQRLPAAWRRSMDQLSKQDWPMRNSAISGKCGATNAKTRAGEVAQDMSEVGS